MLELIVTIFVIMVGLIGVFIIAQYPLSYIQPIFSRLTAAYLAQEGIEVIRNLRDENWLDENQPYWYSGLEGDYEVIFASTFNNLIACNSPCDFDNNLRFLRIMAGTTKFYNYDMFSTEITKFKRKVTITQIGMPIDYLEVKVLVEWEEKGERKKFLVQENLYPWWPQ